MKSPCHGLPVSRAKTGDSPGNSPGPAGMRPRLAPARSATPFNGHKPTDRQLIGDRATGAGAKPAGRRLATDKRHRADTEREVSGLPCVSGAGSGWRNYVQMKGEHPDNLVPMPPDLLGVGAGGLPCAFALFYRRLVARASNALNIGRSFGMCSDRFRKSLITASVISSAPVARIRAIRADSRASRRATIWSAFWSMPSLLSLSRFACGSLA
jgi:hypothetical protein